MVLELKSVDTFYGTSHVLQGVSLEVKEGEVVALLGRNGVGKTTTLRTIMGLAPARAGQVLVEGVDVTRAAPYEIARRGVAYVPDDLGIFPDLTCRENLLIPAKVLRREGYWNLERVEELFPVLAERASQKGLNMSGGEKKMLAIGRALMANPKLVLMDEPSEGLAPLIVSALADAIATIRSHGVTILLADQNLKFCRRVCDRGYILEKGRVVHEGGMEEIYADEQIVRKYLAV